MENISFILQNKIKSLALNGFFLITAPSPVIWRIFLPVECINYFLRKENPYANHHS